VSELNGSPPNSWVLGPMVGLDLETTGVNPEDDRIVTATVIRDIPGADLDILNWTFDPGIEIPTSASDIHGVTTEHARKYGVEARWVTQVWDAVASDWAPNVPLVIYNAPFDLTMMDRELERHTGGAVKMLGPVLCPLTIDRAVDRYRKGKRTLSALCEHYGVELVNAHTSEADVAATLMIMRILGTRHPSVSRLSLDALNRQQKTWYHNWSLNFAGYLSRQVNEVSPEEEEKLRRSVFDLKANAGNWPMIPRKVGG
jgi:DNA polymerase-3 subunit epsilon